jgi:hypothetical protein
MLEYCLKMKLGAGFPSSPDCKKVSMSFYAPHLEMAREISQRFIEPHAREVIVAPRLTAKEVDDMVIIETLTSKTSPTGYIHNYTWSKSSGPDTW